ncbi:MAG TPA: hypothetical protein VM409_08305 [Chloroflexia bacterium]|nr:hypothetical protein [Chloroflexia bacterium]
MLNNNHQAQDTETLSLLLEVSRRAEQIGRQAASSGETPDLNHTLEQAVSSLLLNQEQLITLWAAFMLGSHAVKKAHKDLVATLMH